MNRAVPLIGVIIVILLIDGGPQFLGNGLSQALSAIQTFASSMGL